MRVSSALPLSSRSVRKAPPPRTVYSSSAETGPTPMPARPTRPNGNGSGNRNGSKNGNGSASRNGNKGNKGSNGSGNVSGSASLSGSVNLNTNPGPTGASRRLSPTG